MKYCQFEKILKNLEIKPNDTILIHSDLSKINIGFSWKEKCLKFYKYLEKYFMPNGTILVPTFTYSFCKTGKFNKIKSPSELGIFTEYFRKQKNHLRSDHPIFSFSIKGKFKNIISNKNSLSGTGKGSVFEKLFYLDAKILFFGISLIKSCTFLHFIEQSVGVPYRYSKYFKKKNSLKKFEFYARKIRKYKFYTLKENSLIERDLLKNNIYTKAKFTKNNIGSCNCKSLYFFVKKKLQKNKYYIIGKKPKLILK
jgi:aminoglycoside 3-N-acetyltransferase